MMIAAITLYRLRCNIVRVTTARMTVNNQITTIDGKAISKETLFVKKRKNNRK